MLEHINGTDVARKVIETNPELRETHAQFLKTGQIKAADHMIATITMVELLGINIEALNKVLFDATNNDLPNSQSLIKG